MSWHDAQDFAEDMALDAEIEAAYAEAEARDADESVCSACFGSGVERYDHGLGERCSLCKGRRT